MTDAPAIFGQGADTYDQLRRQLIPPFEVFYDTAVDALALGVGAPRRVLDLGAGTGLLSERILAKHPGAELTLLDGAPAMLEQARKRIGDRARYLVGDLADPLPAGRWDAIVSALAIHHLHDHDKRELFVRIHTALQPGGVFVNAEQVSGPSVLLERAYRNWHQDTATRLGCQSRQWRDAEERMRVDRLADLESQLQWLRVASFIDVDCIFKQYCFATMVARRSDVD
jgi:tRNA (cmo5U34)-methyltransferase